MKLNVNGETTHIEASTLYDLLRTYDLVGARGVAVAVNDDVVQKSRWKDYRLHDNDRIEIVRALQGG